eukprot:gene9279-19258_t
MTNLRKIISLLVCSYAFSLRSFPITRQVRISSTLTSAVPPEALFVDSSFNLAAGSAVVGTVCGVLENFKGPTARLFGAGAILFTLFGGFLAFQTATLRFTFDETSFALVKADSSSIGENIVVGGENKWAYKSFVNWQFLPSKDFPILVYFKETQTPESNREEVPIKIDDLNGQVHFFPAIANTQQLEENFLKNGCKKQLLTAFRGNIDWNMLVVED